MVAMSAPFAYLAGRQTYMAVLAVAVVSGLALWAVLSCPAALLRFPVYCLIAYGSLVVATVTVSQWSSAIWPTGKAWPVVPLTLLALATASAWYGANRASGSVGVLFWIITILYSILLGFGFRNVRLEYLRPQLEVPGGLCWFVFLLPCAAQFLPRERGKGIWPYVLALTAMGILAAVWTEGNLSARIAEQMPWPFYGAGESVQLFGIANRLESLISVGATLGLYSLYSLLLSAVGHLADNIRNGCGKYGVLLGGILSAAGVLLRWEIPLFVLAGGAFVLWIAVPVLGAKILSKKGKIFENNA